MHNIIAAQGRHDTATSSACTQPGDHYSLCRSKNLLDYQAVLSKALDHCNIQNSCTALHPGITDPLHGMAYSTELDTIKQAYTTLKDQLGILDTSKMQRTVYAFDGHYCLASTAQKSWRSAKATNSACEPENSACQRVTSWCSDCLDLTLSKQDLVGSSYPVAYSSQKCTAASRGI